MDKKTQETTKRKTEKARIARQKWDREYEHNTAYLDDDQNVEVDPPNRRGD